MKKVAIVSPEVKRQNRSCRISSLLAKLITIEFPSHLVLNEMEMLGL